MKIRHQPAIALSGISWMVIGIFLLVKGFALILSPIVIEQETIFLPFLRDLTGSFQQAALILVFIGLFIGFLKGKIVLRKTAGRLINRITDLPNPSPISQIYPRAYFLLLALMVGLGISLRWIPVPSDLKGVIDVAIGSALVQGSAFYFRYFAIQSLGKRS